MPVLRWDQKYSVGVPTLDAQHQNLFVMINAIQEAMLAGRMRRVQQVLVDEVVEELRLHFAREERLLGGSGYPQMGEHRRAHRELLEEIERLREGMRAGIASRVLDLLDLLRQWWPRHLVETDLEYRQWLLPK